MSETGNIEKMAHIVANEIFKWFKWDVAKPKNLNWQCVNENHGKKTHPSDLVFFYDDPYSGFTKYINVDLKSYAAGSINKAHITSALRSLAMSVECANVSSAWQDTFIQNEGNFDKVVGMLFIYNHDGNYDKNFKDEINKIDFREVSIQENTEILLFGPGLIERLYNVVTDLRLLKSDNKLTNLDGYTFLYPDLVRARRSGDEWGKPATLETLTSPWMVIKHRETADIPKGFLIYYHEEGKSVEEFIYLIDAMAHYQLFSDDNKIRVRLTSGSDNALPNFEKAKSEYLRIWGEDEARRKQMDKIDVSKITNFSTQFSAIEIGMRDNV